MPVDLASDCCAVWGEVLVFDLVLVQLPKSNKNFKVAAQQDLYAN